MQPWTFIWKNEKLFCFIENKKATAIFDITGVATLLSAGAMLENIKHISKSLGYNATIEVCKESDEAFATIDFESNPNKQDNSLAEAIYTRNTNRFLFLKKEPSKDIIDKLFNTYKSNSVNWLYTLNKEKLKKTAKIFDEN